MLASAYRFARPPVSDTGPMATAIIVVLGANTTSVDAGKACKMEPTRRRPLVCSRRLSLFKTTTTTTTTTTTIVAFGALLVLATALIRQATVSTATATSGDQQQDSPRDDETLARERQLHPSLYVDVKYWIRNMEFADRDNWRHRLRPCTLLERISIEANRAVISLGDAIDNSFSALESSSVRELVLANDGLLLLEEDTLGTEQAYIRYLNESGDCFDSSTLPESHLQDEYWFRFEPSSDELSWFNSANWMSAALDHEIAELVPDSHQIPCGEDVVWFGSRHASYWSMVDEKERSPVIAFKVNFRPSEQLMMVRDQTKREGIDQQQQPIGSATSPASTYSIVDTMRVSKLKIGDKSYTQDEFDELVRLYRDNLFDFNDEKSIFNLATGNQSHHHDADAEQLAGGGGGGRPQRALTIDESSIHQAPAGQEEQEPLCLDEAGCLCGNEQASMMEVICSFYQPLELNDMLCLDPIRSGGYCNRICATSIMINMAPTKFSERYLASLLNKLMTGGGGQLNDLTTPQRARDYFGHIFVGSRRIDHTKYEITLRLVPADNDVYRDIIGRDLELAQLIKQQLEKAAIKSFYGIKTVNIKSSVLWRRDSRRTIFWLALVTTLSLFVTLFVHYDNYLTSIIVSQIIFAQLKHFDAFNRVPPSSNETPHASADDQFIGTHQLDRHGLDQTSVGTGGGHDENNLSGQEFAMIELDARSITDSTHGLLIE